MTRIFSQYFCIYETSVIDTFKNQISSVIIDITKNEKQSSTKNVIKCIYTNFTIFSRLGHLNFGQSSILDQRLSFSTIYPTVLSSTRGVAKGVP